MPKVYTNVTKHDPGMWDMVFAKPGNIYHKQTWFFMHHALLYKQDVIIQIWFN
jgi:hypothetical protein